MFKSLRSFRCRAARNGNRQAMNRASRTAYETLETRLMFVSFSIDGSPNADGISISIDGNDILYAVNGQSERKLDAIYNGVEINGNGGDDTITIVETGANEITVNGGNGNDTVNLALGANDLDAIDDFVIVNGDAGDDTVKLWDSSDSGNVAYGFSNGTLVGRTNMATLTANTEHVTIEASSGANQFEFFDPPTPSIVLKGNGSTGDFINMHGEAGEDAFYLPSGVDGDSGSITFETNTIVFDTVESVHADGFNEVEFRTPHANDTISTANGSLFTGLTGTTAMAPLQIDSIGTLFLDVGTNDNASGNDTVTLAGTAHGASVYAINAGIGTNVLNVNNTYTIDTDRGPDSGLNLEVKVNSGTTIFQGFQNLKRIELTNSTTAQLGGAGTVVNVRDLALVGGAASINVGTGQGLSQLSPGTFSITAGGTLNKKGLGGMSVAGPQSHGVGSSLDVLGGTLNFLSDCGTPTTRNLAVNAQSGVVNFNTTQHLAGVGVNFGDINLGTNGNRVLVTDAVGVSGEGGSINLNNNDMIVNYTGASVLDDVRVLLKAGYASGGWGGIGINSASAASDPIHATALGYAEASTILGVGGGTFSGQSVDGSAILVKYTFYGDANLSGNVDTIDFNILASNFSKTGKLWSDGDSDYQQDVDTVDFNLTAANFSKTGLGPANAALPAASAAQSLFGDNFIDDNASLI